MEERVEGLKGRGGVEWEGKGMGVGEKEKMGAGRKLKKMG